MRRKRGQALRTRRGATMIIVAVTAVVLMSFAALAIDLSRLFAYRNELQRSADAAALAGAFQLTKSTYSNAADTVTQYANLNTIEGQRPTIDSVTYGTWDPVAHQYTATCVALPVGGCTAATMAAAAAIRVVLTGGPNRPILAQFLGQTTGTNAITVSAVAWNTPTMPQHDCIKPITLPYSSLIAKLDTAEGQPTNFPFDSLRVLTAIDLDTLRSATVLLQCLTPPGAPAAACTSGSEPATTPDFGYTPAQVYPPGAGSLPAQIQAACAGTDTVGPGDPLDTASTVNGFAFNPAAASDAALQWCSVYGNPPWTPGVSPPCLMKLALWQNATAAGTSTDGLACTGAAPCVLVRTILPYVITNMDPSGAIEGYPTVAADEAALPPGGFAPPPSALNRVVLVQ